MHRANNDETAAVNEKQENERYTAHMLQDEHKDAVN
jgi:hypothetical protein